MSHNAPKTLILIASADDGLARAVAMSMIEDKRLLHEKFNNTRAPSWQAMTNHLPPGATQDEILASLEDVLDRPDRYMMVMSGYEDTPAWNNALQDIMQRKSLSATFVHEEGDKPPAALRSLFQAYTELSDETEDDPVTQTRIAIMHARAEKGAVTPFDAAPH